MRGVTSTTPCYDAYRSFMGGALMMLWMFTGMVYIGIYYATFSEGAGEVTLQRNRSGFCT